MFNSEKMVNEQNPSLSEQFANKSELQENGYVGRDNNAFDLEDIVVQELSYDTRFW